MINQQALKQLHKQARRQSIRLELETRPETWQWAFAFLGHLSQVQSDKRSANGLLAVQFPDLEQDLNWLELPAEWKSPSFVRLQYLAGPSRYLAWEIELQPQAVTFVQFTHLPAKLDPLFQDQFEQISQKLEQGLTQLTAGFKQLEALQNQQSTDISPYFEALRSIWGKVELGQIVSWMKIPLASVLEQVATQIYNQELWPEWTYHLAGEPRSQQIKEWQNQIDSLRWQTKVDLKLEQVYLCLRKSDSDPNLFLALQQKSQQLLIFPGQNRKTDLKSTSYWQSPALNLAATSPVLQTSPKITAINLSQQITQATGPILTPETHWSHQEKFPLSLLLNNLPGTPFTSAAELIVFKNCWPFLKNIWPKHKLQFDKMLLLSISTSARFPAAWLNQLEQNCHQQGGAIFEQSSQGALLMLPHTAGLDYLAFLAQSLQTMHQLLQQKIPFQVLLHRGEVELILHEQRFRLLGQGVRFLSEMAQKFEPDSGFLVSAAVIADSESQHRLHQAKWRIFEYNHLREQALFLLQIPVQE